MKKIISFIIVLITIASTLVYAESGDLQSAYNEGYNDGYNDGASQVYTPKVPSLSIVQPKDIQTVKAGEYIDLILNYKNNSEYTASKIKITPIFDESIFEYERPIVYESSNSLRKNREGVATLNLKVKDSVKKGIYEVKLKIEYRNNNDEVYSNIDSTFVRVTEEKLKSLITVDTVETIPAQVIAEEQFKIRFNINNIGDIDANEVSVKLNGLSESTFMAVNDKDYSYIGNIKAQSTYYQEFDLVASKDIPKGNNKLSVTVKYKDSDGESVQVDKQLYILNVISDNEKEDGDNSSSKPKIMIESYSTNPQSIVAGDSIKFSFKFKNTSNTKTINNMKITISSEEGAFMIAHGSNTFYVEKLGPKESCTKSIELNVKQDLASKSYPVIISFDYEDSSANSYVSNEVINLPVIEYSKLVINSAGVFDCMVNNQASLSFDYINMGRARISNLTATVEGDFESVQSINYIGNLDAGYSDYYDIMVIPTKEGEIYGTLVLNFEDSSGKNIEVRKDFSAFAMGEYNPGMDIGFDDPTYYDEPIDEKMSFNWWQITLMGIGAFLVTFIISKIITSKIVRKKLEDEI